jgi:hypothetical protein
MSITHHLVAGGKAKPLKAAKKEKKELDETDLAYREKQKAGANDLPLQLSNIVSRAG